MFKTVIACALLLDAGVYANSFIDNAFADTQQQFSAGVTAMESEVNTRKIENLGVYRLCKVVEKQADDNQNSACYLKRDNNKNWQLESVNAICIVECR